MSMEDRYEDEQIYDREVGDMLVTTQTIRFLNRSYDPDEVSIHITEDGDNLFSLADEYYDDFTLWWVIAEKNPSIVNPFEVPVGMELIVPNI